VTGTVTQGVSGEVRVNADIVIAGAEAKAGLNLTYALSAYMGNNVSTPTRPHKRTLATYGVSRTKTSGTYTVISGQCTPRNYPITAWTPWIVGWNVYEVPV